MISGLQEDFGDLGIKYPKQNISKCRSEHQISKAKYLKMSVGNIKKLQEKFRCTVQNEDLVVSIIRVCFLIVGGNGSDESQVSDEPSCPGNLNWRLRMLSGSALSEDPKHV